jgi:hypothetical protein
MGLMTMQAQVRAVRSRSTRAAVLPAGVLPSAGSLVVAAPYARVPFVLQPGPMRGVGGRADLRAPPAVFGREASGVVPQGLLETVIIISGVLVVAALAAGGLYGACTLLDKYNAALCKANCGNTPCKKGPCLAVGVCCEFTCPNVATAPAGGPWGGP